MVDGAGSPGHGGRVVSESGPMELNFTEEPGELSAELRAAIEWMQRLLPSLVREGVHPSCEWRVRYGRRTGGGRLGVPAMSQYGFMVQGVDRASGEAYSLTCFVWEDDVVDELSRPVVEQILALWLDRLG